MILASRGHLGRPLGGFLERLGGLLARLGAISGVLERSLGVSAPSRAVMGASWGPPGPSWGFLGGFWARGGPPCFAACAPLQSLFQGYLAYLGYSKPSRPHSQPVFFTLPDLEESNTARARRGPAVLSPQSGSHGGPPRGKTRTPMSLSSGLRPIPPPCLGCESEASRVFVGISW